MIDDLNGKGKIKENADFLIIGAGTVGLIVSSLLTKRTGKKVICLESGGEEQNISEHPLNKVILTHQEYKGASEGRFRCIGGTSTRWGGALIPFQSADLNQANWAIKIDELLPYISEVEDIFGLDSSPYVDEQFHFDLGEAYINRLAKWPTFKKTKRCKII